MYGGCSNPGVLLGHTSHLGFVRARSSEGVVISLKITGEFHKSLNNEGLDVTSLLHGVARGESESTDGSSGSASGGDDVFAGGVNLSIGDLGDIHVGGVDGISSVSSVSGGNNGVHDFLEESP